MCYWTAIVVMGCNLFRETKISTYNNYSLRRVYRVLNMQLVTTAPKSQAHWDGCPSTFSNVVTGLHHNLQNDKGVSRIFLFSRTFRRCSASHPPELQQNRPEASWDLLPKQLSFPNCRTGSTAQLLHQNTDTTASTVSEQT